MSETDKGDVLEKVALKYQDLITQSYDTLAKDCFNIPEHRYQMKTEAVISSTYFRATRRYAQWITKKEGFPVDELDIKGLEFMKVNFPKFFGDFFHKILEDVLKGSPKEDIDIRIKNFKELVMDKDKTPLSILGNPTSVKTLDEYRLPPKQGGVFSEIKKKAPAPVVAAIRYNDLLKFWGLDKEHVNITKFDKIKWVYLKDNPYKIEKLGFLEHDIPEKIQQYLDQYADREMVFESILLTKLENFYDDLNWWLDLNPYLEVFDSFEV